MLKQYSYSPNAVSEFHYLAASNLPICLLIIDCIGDTAFGSGKLQDHVHTHSPVSVFIKHGGSRYAQRLLIFTVAGCLMKECTTLQTLFDKCDILVLNQYWKVTSTDTVMRMISGWL